MGSNLGIVIRREYLERVKKKSFIITTILMPVFMVALMAAPALIAMFYSSDKKVIEVIDESGIIFQNLKSGDEVQFVKWNLGIDSARASLDKNYGVLHIAKDVVNSPGNIKLYTRESSSMSLETNINSQIKRVIEDEKLKQYNIENINKILDEVKTEVSIQTFRNDGEEDSSSSTTASFGLSMALGLFLYMFLMLYGQMVMTSVIEEKNNRVLEVLVSSVKPFNLMLGKIFGVALVAITQILIWGTVITLVAAIVMPMLIPADVMQSVALLKSGTLDVNSTGMDMDMLQVLAMVSNIGYILQIIVYLVLFLIGGFLLYAAMFAAVGSSVDNIQDASQLQTIIILPIIVSFVLMMTIVNDPNSSLAFWLSMIPFSSPVIMMARIPFGIPVWESILSLVVLYVSFVGVVWLAAKIYRVGIFMYGKKPTWKELYKWTKYKY